MFCRRYRFIGLSWVNRSIFASFLTQRNSFFRYKHLIGKIQSAFMCQNVARMSFLYLSDTMAIGLIRVPEAIEKKMEKQR